MKWNQDAERCLFVSAVKLTSKSLGQRDQTLILEHDPFNTA